MADGDRVAVLIDCDNTSARRAPEILEEVSRHGTLGVRRGYGDWSSPLLSGWSAVLARHAIQPVHQVAYTTGKNATDIALVIDAVDLLHSGTVDTFALVSSDSDLTRLAMRLRESGRRVYGVGRATTPESFRNACDRFTYLEVLAEEEVAPRPPALRAVLARAIEASAKEDGWAMLSAVGSYVVTKDPGFDARNYGHPKLSNLARAQSYVEVKEIPAGGGAHQLWVRLRPEATARTA